MTQNAQTEPGQALPEASDLEADIERTRADLAHTVDQLAAKLDVKTRLRHRLSAAKTDATEQWTALRNRASGSAVQADRQTVSIGAGVLAGAMAVIVVGLWRRNRAPHRRGWSLG